MFALTKKPKKPAPNYFVAIQVNNPKIQESLEQVQTTMLKNKPNIKKALISVPSLHITLIVMHISNEEDLQRAREALDVSFDALKDDLKKNPLTLTFEGLSNFKNKVLYADMKIDESQVRLQNIYNIIVSNFESHGFDGVRERDMFTPHLTIAKLSKAPKLRQKGIYQIFPDWYNDYLNCTFGSQLVMSLQLLRMFGPKDDMGYYHCDHECFLDNPTSEDEKVTLEKMLVKSSENKTEVREKIRQLTMSKLEGKDLS